MVVADLPQAVQDGAAWAGFLLLISGLLGVMFKSRLGRWVFRKLISEPLTDKAREVINESLDPVYLEVEDLRGHIANIGHELTTNNGSSLKDAIRATEAESKATRRLLARMAKWTENFGDWPAVALTDDDHSAAEEGLDP